MLPFTKDASASVAHLGEVALIERIRQWLGSASPAAPHGMGDDCAVLNPIAAGRQIITVDSVSYGQHFEASVSPEDAGAKLIKRNLSDIAAMGGVPGPAVLALLSSSDLSVQWLQRFFTGIRQTCERYGVTLVGGDISSLAHSNFSAVLTLTGSAQSPALRSTAGDGDQIYVTGTLGGSILGKHIHFEPRLSEGQWLAQTQQCSALMDLTDGLAKDLQTLVPADAHAALDLPNIPIASAARSLATESGRPPLAHACCDGEDYELLFTLDAHADSLAFERQWQQQFPQTPLHCIGQIRLGATMGTLIDAHTHSALPWTQGYEHLQSK